MAVQKQGVPEKMVGKKEPCGYGSRSMNKHGGAVAWTWISDLAYLCQIFKATLRPYGSDRKSWVFLSGLACPRLPLTVLLLSPLYPSFTFWMDVQADAIPLMSASLSHEKEYVMVGTHYEFLLQRRWLISLFSLPLFIQLTRWKIFHTLENSFVVCIWDCEKVCTRRKGKTLGSGLVEASGDFTQKNGSRLRRQAYKQAGRSRGANKLWRRLLVSLKRGRRLGIVIPSCWGEVSGLGWFFLLNQENRL